ncbi:hypothetical protein [Thermococcus sp.]
MLKLYQILPREILKILAKYNFRLVGPWREYYLVRGNVFLIRELPLKITFKGRDKRIINELKPYAKRIITDKNRASFKIGRHWIVLEFEG